MRECAQNLRDRGRLVQAIPRAQIAIAEVDDGGLRRAAGGRGGGGAAHLARIGQPGLDQPLERRVGRGSRLVRAWRAPPGLSPDVRGHREGDAMAERKPVAWAGQEVELGH